ncbi:MAG: hypothetical protein ABR608_10875 [Pseudonocardiaceae bacterium]
MIGEAPPSGEHRGEAALAGADSVLTTLIEQMHRNWDQGNNAANDDLVVRIRDHIRSQRETSTTRNVHYRDVPSPQ